MPVSDQHNQYRQYLKQWRLVRDCVMGSTAVKSRGGLYKGSEYLPIPNPDDTSADNRERYEAYVQRANFVNFTGHTKKGMVGMVFRKETNCDFPKSIEYIKENANGGGLSLDQLIRDVLGNALETGRYGLLIDYPSADEGLTQAQVKRLGLRANILPYTAESIINWRTEVVGAVKTLSLVVLEEAHENISTDGFTVESVTYHRVLKMVDGVYVQYLYDESDNVIAEFTPRKSDGSLWKEIPFVFVGSQNNDETVDEAPLYDLAEVNLAHYRNSADYEESSFMVGQPTPVFAGLSQGWVETVLKDKIHLGSRSAVPLPEGGSAMLLQASENQMPMKGMETKEQQMIRIGARIIQDNTGQETAEAAKIRFAGQNSELATIVGNIEAAITKAAVWLLAFMGGDGDPVIEINKQFYDASMDSQQAMALIQFADRGDISQVDLRSRLRKSGWLDAEKTDEEIDAELTDYGPTLTNVS